MFGTELQLREKCMAGKSVSSDLSLEGEGVSALEGIVS